MYYCVRGTSQKYEYEVNVLVFFLFWQFDIKDETNKLLSHYMQIDIVSQAVPCCNFAD